MTCPICGLEGHNAGQHVRWFGSTPPHYHGTPEIGLPEWMAIGAAALIILWVFLT